DNCYQSASIERLQFTVSDVSPLIMALPEFSLTFLYLTDSMRFFLDPKRDIDAALLRLRSRTHQPQRNHAADAEPDTALLLCGELWSGMGSGPGHDQ
nr:hypothetical protein [Tanacetum cinerariifolium]